MNPKKKERLLKDEKIQDRAHQVVSLIGSIRGENVTREGLADTPLRVAAMYEELFSGYKQDGVQILNDAMFADVNSKDMVLVKDMQFYSTCEHHMMPFFGTVAIAYIPQDGRIVGLSKLARLVEVYARRLQVQERMGQQIADDIEAVMNPRAVAVIIKAEHTCMTARGVQKPGTQTITSCLRGSFFLDEKAREELVEMLKY
jgi:GTP cyclohydrolase I